MPIRPLADIMVDHQYFASGSYAGAVVTPTAATVARLRGLRMVVKPLPGGLRLFVDLGDDGKPRLAIPDNVRLGFDLMALPPDLAAATDMTGIGPGTVFSSDGLAAGQPLKRGQRQARATETLAKAAGAQTLALAGRPLSTATKADFTATPAAVTVTGYDAAGNRVTVAGPAGTLTLDYPVRPPVRPGVLAPIEVTIGAATATLAAAGKPARFAVALKPVAARWAYHLVTDLTNPVAEWRVQHPNGDGPAVSFGDAGRSELAPDAADDPFGADLARRASPLRVLRFVSDAPVPASDTVARRIALFAGTQQLFPSLPNPTPAATRMLGGQPVFGQLLRFVTT